MIELQRRPAYVSLLFILLYHRNKHFCVRVSEFSFLPVTPPSFYTTCSVISNENCRQCIMLLWFWRKMVRLHLCTIRSRPVRYHSTGRRLSTLDHYKMKEWYHIPYYWSGSHSDEFYWQEQGFIYLTNTAPVVSWSTTTGNEVKTNQSTDLFVSKNGYICDMFLMNIRVDILKQCICISSHADVDSSMTAQ